ncbi:hypothetical protein BC826DRAFT_971136 [Russula brevipes]|nr:hypothetical protein BC826DRAFT_971136 [Russula brevipes]
MVVSVIRIIKRTAHDNAFDWTVTALKTLSDVAPIPPLTVATNVVLSILQIISFQDIKTNQQGCLSLMRRATELLMFLQKRMKGKEDAPQSLLDDIREFEETLRSIHKFICRLTQLGLVRRGFEKSSIQDQLVQHEQRLEDARWRFQLSLSIETSYAQGVLGGPSSNNPPRIVGQGAVANPMEIPEAPPSSLAGYPPKFPVSGFEVVNQFHGHDNIGGFKDRQMQMYGSKNDHQEIRRGKDLALKQWVRDIKTLRNLQFVLARFLVAFVANRRHNRALDEVMQSVLTTRGMADCASLILRTRQHRHPWIATTTCGRKKQVLVGLEDTVVRCVTKVLQRLVDVESSALQVGPHKMATTFNDREGLDLSPELEDLLDGANEAEEYLVVPLKPGDYGYITGDSKDFPNFWFLEASKIVNLDEMKHVVGETDCTMFMWRHDPVICHRNDFPAIAPSVQDERECWEVPLLENDAGIQLRRKVGLASAKSAWEFLVANGASLASRHGIEPQALILVTRYERQDYYGTSEWFSSLRGRHSIELGSTTSDCPAFPVPEFRAEAPSDVSMLYFVTSSRRDFEAYVTDEPLTAVPHRYCQPWTQNEVVDYIQLDADDMVS